MMSQKSSLLSAGGFVQCGTSILSSSIFFKPIFYKIRFFIHVIGDVVKARKKPGNTADMDDISAVFPGFRNRSFYFRPGQSIYFIMLMHPYENQETGTVPLCVARSYLLYSRTVREAPSPEMITGPALPIISHF